MQVADTRRADGSGALDSVAFVRFRLGGFPLALEAGHVARVAPAPEQTRLPGAPATVTGLGYVGGRPTVLVSLAGRLDVEPEGEDRRVVVVAGERTPAVGLLTDGGSELVTAPVEAVTPADAAEDFFLGDAATDPLFRAVVAADAGQAYVLAPAGVTALARGTGAGVNASTDGGRRGGGRE
ncbi:chemotaxis protein CheW [Haloglomus litoreum]|uniref:chemotaxis protein CheW n=1 Tax=Haloglomus litoreum TaxID=3034026 RepID=UPI0023E78778|nr:chemotaxis protein CheW [Haloglomus sp. DT116]